MTPDPIVQDARRAAFIFMAALGLLLLAAATGLCNWPGQDVLLKTGMSVPQIIGSVQGYAVIVAAIFWGSSPSVPARRWSFLLGIVAAGLAAIAYWPSLSASRDIASADYDWTVLLTVSFGTSALALLMPRVLRRPRSQIDERLRALAVLVLLFWLVPVAALQLTVTTHPATFDFYAMRWDAAAGLGFTPALVVAVDRFPLLGQAVSEAYMLTPLLFLAPAILQLRGRPAHVATAVLLWVVLSACALAAYHFFPIAGPQYVFGADHFVAKLREGQQQSIAPVLVGPAPRNGMPSMHFGWALSAAILWFQTSRKWFGRTVMAFSAVLVAIATLYKGEHYVVDLIVAVPFSLACVAVAATGVNWAARRPIALLGFGAWLAWVVALRDLMPVFIHHPSSCWLAIAATVAAATLQVRAMRRFPVDLNSDESATTVEGSRSKELGPAHYSLRRWALLVGVPFAFAIALPMIQPARTLSGPGAASGWMAVVVWLFGALSGAIGMQRWSRRWQAEGLLTRGFFLGALLQFAVTLGVGPIYNASGWVVPVLVSGVVFGQLSSWRVPGLSALSVLAVLASSMAVGVLLGTYVVGPVFGISGAVRVSALLGMLDALAMLGLWKQSGATPISDVPVFQRGPTAATSTLRVTGSAGIAAGGTLVFVAWSAASVVLGQVETTFYGYGLWLALFAATMGIGFLVASRSTFRTVGLVRDLLWVAAALLALTPVWQQHVPGYLALFDGYSPVNTFSAREALGAFVALVLLVPLGVLVGWAIARLLCVPHDEERVIVLPPLVGALAAALALVAFGHDWVPSVVVRGLAAVTLLLALGATWHWKPGSAAWVGLPLLLGGVVAVQWTAPLPIPEVPALPAPELVSARVASSLAAGKATVRMIDETQPLMATQSGAWPEVMVLDSARHWDRVVAPRLTKEALHSAAQHLGSTEGALVVGLPLDRLKASDVLIALATARSVFPYVALWGGEGGQAALVASSNAYAIARDEPVSGIRLILPPASLDRLLAATGARGGAWIATGDRPRLMFSAPQDAFSDPKKTLQANQVLLHMFGG
jgi:hypothetical protein